MQDEQQHIESVQDTSAELLMLPAERVPVELATWLEASGAPAMVVSIERLNDGRLALQALPELDPTIVARIRKVLAEHADVLRRLT